MATIKDSPTRISHNTKIAREELPETIAHIIGSELDNGVAESEICVLAPQWWHLFSMAPKLKKLLPSVSFDAPDISPIKYDRFNPFYLLAQLVFTDAGQKVSIRKRVTAELLSILQDDFKIPIPEGIDIYDILRTINLSIDRKEDSIAILQNSISAVFRLLKIQLNHEKHLREVSLLFFEKIQGRVLKYSMATDYASVSKFFKERSGLVLSTIHGVKGEEYTTVIAFALLNGYLPHWNFIMKADLKPIRFNETQKLLYVLCSRAKKNIYLFSERGHKTKSDNNYSPTNELVAGIRSFELKPQAI